MPWRGLWRTALLGFTTLLALLPVLGYVGEVTRVTSSLGANWHHLFNVDLFDEWGSYQTVLDRATMVRDRFQWVEVRWLKRPHRAKVFVRSADPETGDGLYHRRQIPPSYEFTVNSSEDISEFYILGDANHLWMIDSWANVIELEGNRSRETNSKQSNVDLPPHESTTLSSHQVFVWDGKLMSVFTSDSDQREVSQWIDGHWQSIGEIAFPDAIRGPHRVVRRMLANPLAEISEQKMTEEGSVSEGRMLAQDLMADYEGTDFEAHEVINIQIIDSSPHLFWKISGRLFHHFGIPLRPVTPKKAVPMSGHHSVDASVSALQPVNSSQLPDGWTFVCENVEFPSAWFPVAVGRQPAIVRIERPQIAYPKARALRFEAGKWFEFSSIELPMASLNYHAGLRDDGERSYLVASTPLAHSRVFAIEPDGFRDTRIELSEAIKKWNLIPIFFRITISGWVWGLVTGLFLAVIATLVMRRDRAQHEFGLQTATLASVWTRGCARIIDGLFLLLLTVAFVYGLMSLMPLDWKTAAEATHFKVLDHPSITTFETAMGRVGIATLTWILIVTTALAFIQGRFAMTPGKWICGLRVLRVTLKPCGFARSLLRELLLCVDSLNLISWAPGIFCIASNRSRQRLGDLVADTVVICKRSLIRQIKLEAEPSKTESS